MTKLIKLPLPSTAGRVGRAAHRVRMRLEHFAQARYYHGYGVHSPFVFHIVREVVNDHHRDTIAEARLTALRRTLAGDHTLLSVPSIGAVTSATRQRTVADIYHRTACTTKQGRLLLRLARDMHPDNVVELGTSVGVSAAYLSAALPEATIHSIEGIEAVAALARRHLAEGGFDNVRVIVGDIDAELPALIASLPQGKVQMAYIDANHTREATLRYFGLLADAAADLALLIFDDIFWSQGMTEAWRLVAADERVATAIELANVGLAFFRHGCQKEYYKVRD